MPPPVECHMEPENATTSAPPRGDGFVCIDDDPPGGGSRAIIEIGPHDLPPPEDGYEELVLDEPDPPRPAATPFPPFEVAPEAVARPGPPARAEAARSRPSPRSRWFLFPEALVVGGFVLIGLLLAGVTHFTRSARLPAAPRSTVAPLAGGAPTAAPRDEAARDPEPTLPDVPPVPPEEPPVPALAPSSIQGLLPARPPASGPASAPPGPGAGAARPLTDTGPATGR